MTSCRRKSRRLALATSDAAMVVPSSPSPWTTSLPDDLLRLIAWRVLEGDYLDYVRLRAVCTSWRSGTVSPRGLGVTDPRFHPRRWMMLTEGHGLYPGYGKLRGYVRFFNLYTGIFVRVKLQLFRNHCAFDSVDGLLVLQRDEDTTIRVLHPFTGDIAELPPLATLLTQLDGHPNGAPESDRWFHIRNNDRHWTMTSWEIPPAARPLSFRGKLYMVRLHNQPGTSQVLQIDHPLQNETGLGSRQPSPPSIHKLADLMVGSFIPVTSIGDRALFMNQRSLSVSSKSLPTVRADTVVYTHQRKHDFAQFQLGTGIWSRPIDECGLDGFAPGPCSLIHHVLSCCFRNVWNKGLIYSKKEYKKSGWLLWKVKRKFRTAGC